MAILKAVNSKASIDNAINYVTKKEKTEERLLTGKDCDPNCAIDDMKATKELWGKTDGRQYKHFMISYHKDEKITHEKAHELAVEFANENFKNFEVVIATHKDKEHVHTHFIVNSVSFVDGKKFQQSKKEYERLKEYCNQQCRDNGLNVAQKGKHFDGTEKKEKSIYSKDKYNLLKKAEEGKAKSFVYDYKTKILDCISKSKDFEDFKNRIGDYGLIITRETKNEITFASKENVNKKARLSRIMGISKEELINKIAQSQDFEPIDEDGKKESLKNSAPVINSISESNTKLKEQNKELAKEFGTAYYAVAPTKYYNYHEVKNNIDVFIKVSANQEEFLDHLKRAGYNVTVKNGELKINDIDSSIYNFTDKNGKTVDLYSLKVITERIAKNHAYSTKPFSYKPIKSHTWTREESISFLAYQKGYYYDKNTGRVFKQNPYWRKDAFGRWHKRGDLEVFLLKRAKYEVTHIIRNEYHKQELQRKAWEDARIKRIEKACEMMHKYAIYSPERADQVMLQLNDKVNELTRIKQNLKYNNGSELEIKGLDDSIKALKNDIANINSNTKPYITEHQAEYEEHDTYQQEHIRGPVVELESKKAITKSQEEVTKAQINKLSEAISEVKRLKAEEKAIDKQIEQKNEESKKLFIGKDAREELKSQIEELESRKAQIKKFQKDEIISLNDVFGTQFKNIKDVELRIEYLNNELRSREVVAEPLRGKLQPSNDSTPNHNKFDELSGLVKEHDILEKELERKKELLKKFNSAKESSKMYVESKEVELSKKMDTMNNTVWIFAGKKKAELQKEIDEIKSDLSSERVKIGSLNEQIGLVEDEIKSIKAKKTGLENQIAVKAHRIDSNERNKSHEDFIEKDKKIDSEPSQSFTHSLSSIKAKDWGDNDYNSRDIDRIKKQVKTQKPSNLQKANEIKRER